jgi:DNA-binding NarL/FixJ family response regulator
MLTPETEPRGPVSTDLAWPTRVLIVDDAASTRLFLRAVLADAPGFDVAGEADNGETAVVQASVLQPDLILLDLSMPQLDGSRALVGLRQVAPDAQVILLSGMDPTAVKPLLDGGVSGFVPKGLGPAETLERIVALVSPPVPPPAVAAPPPSAPPAVTAPAPVSAPAAAVDTVRDLRPEVLRAANAPTPPTTAATTAVTAPRAVLCEDDAATRRLISQVLEDCAVAVAAETETVQNLLAVVELTQPELVILDLWLEGTPGGSALHEIRRRSPGSVVVVYSAHEAWKDQALAAGAGAFVAKPHFDELAAQIRRLTPRAR